MQRVEVESVNSSKSTARIAAELNCRRVVVERPPAGYADYCY